MASCKASLFPRKLKKHIQNVKFYHVLANDQFFFGISFELAREKEMCIIAKVGSVFCPPQRVPHRLVITWALYYCCCLKKRNIMFYEDFAYVARTQGKCQRILEHMRMSLFNTSNVGVEGVKLFIFLDMFVNQTCFGAF